MSPPPPKRGERVFKVGRGGSWKDAEMREEEDVKK